MDAAPRRIRLLSSQLANQIAAGEVVERPASVLKELLENSIDAGADRIEVEVEKGGIGLIRVRDNGAGIHHEDLALAVSPHATSKVFHQNDLTRLVSLGFRGEALASIASVSRLSITTRREADEQGWRVEGSAGEVTPAAHPPGTTVEVRDLFFNTPGRRKFLRSESTEWGHLEQVFRRLALSRFEVGFSLMHNRRRILQVRSAAASDALERRIGEVTGRAFLKTSAVVDFSAAGLRLWGRVAGPEAARSQADLQYFYVNHRLVRDRLIGHALRQAHRDILPEGRHPGYVLFLELDPTQVDVNVHPTKHEVRFREARLIHDFLYRAVRDALEPDLSTLIPRVEQPAGQPRPYPKTELRPVSETAVRESVAGYARLAGPGAVSRPTHTTPISKRTLGRLVDVLMENYLLTEHVDGPRLIDGGAAREALAYHRLQAAWSEGAIRPQPLLVPESLEVERGAIARLERNSERLSRLGFELSPIGETTLMIRQQPAPLRRVQPVPLARALLADLETAGEAALLRNLARCAGTAHRRRMDRAAAEELLAELEPLAEKLSGCWTRLTPAVLARLFEAGQV
ncbi:DNA mismatch repair endonuclease MutL [Thiohalomonas denitrificans]|uniref:DNA mismatch repair protein MutL n=1 Tax=Thiohalomonas denitrificans TaxID=415747 RepID=A0A1G5PK46_9GAMM|nr:DNA mismatch repair endonuclease MutL [Thiohalomonas denitrificans]SCZ49842.1 DNA mismatch repair protein MutL [Thiohalomonas denitrificans]